jgi:hypothetical protein
MWNFLGDTEPINLSDHLLQLMAQPFELGKLRHLALFQQALDFERVRMNVGCAKKSAGADQIMAKCLTGGKALFFNQSLQVISCR